MISNTNEYEENKTPRFLPKTVNGLTFHIKNERLYVEDEQELVAQSYIHDFRHRLEIINFKKFDKRSFDTLYREFKALLKYREENLNG